MSKTQMYTSLKWLMDSVSALEGLYLHIDMPDGNTYKVPVNLIVMHKIDTVLLREEVSIGMEEISKRAHDVVNRMVHSPDMIISWAQREMDWGYVRSHAEIVDEDGSVYEEFCYRWKNGGMKIKN